MYVDLGRLGEGLNVSVQSPDAVHCTCAHIKTIGDSYLLYLIVVYLFFMQSRAAVGPAVCGEGKCLAELQICGKMAFYLFSPFLLFDRIGAYVHTWWSNYGKRDTIKLQYVCCCFCCLFIFNFQQRSSLLGYHVCLHTTKRSSE